jgi:perosamine synthetase
MIMIRDFILIPVFRPYMDEDEKREVLRVLDSRWWGLGPETEKFEGEFLGYLKATYGVATNSGTAALHIALQSLNLRKNDEVILPSFTFVSTAHSIKYVGATPVFADIEKSTLTIDPRSIEEKITGRTKAIIVVHYGGHSCRMDEILKIAKEYDISVIEDCAHAAGAEYKNKKLGTLGDFSAFSFHAVKNIATGDGGMVVSKSSKYVEQMKSFRWVGITKTTWDRYAPSSTKSEENKSSYDVENFGFKYHMNDIQAAIARVQLRRLDYVNEIRRKLVDRYRDNLQGIDKIDLQSQEKWAKSSNHLFVILSKERNRIMKYLNNTGIATSIHYTPVHKFSAYSKDYPNLSLPVTEDASNEILTLPLFPDLTEEQVDYISGKIKEAIR